MKASTVVVAPCHTYEEEKVYQALKTGIDALGGLPSLLSPQEKILVKPNLLKPASAESAVTTHPAVIRSVLRILQENGCAEVLYGDSPGHDTGSRVAHGLQLEPEKPLYGAHFAPMTEEVRTEFADGMTEKEFYFAKEVLWADAIVNVCKLKTHALMRMTGAVKNPFGLICGYRKAMEHVRFPNETLFARMLVDIHRCVKPRLHIMDAIVAMEGNGPGSGVPVPMHVLLISTDAVALDAVACRLIHIDPEMVATNVQGAAMGIGTYQTEEISLLLAECDGSTVSAKGEKAALQTTMQVTMDTICKRFGQPDFDAERRKKGVLMRALDVLQLFAKRPVIDERLCISCGICVQHCPVPGKAIHFEESKNNVRRPPVYDYKKCIRCYCCQEMCPKQAITTSYRKRNESSRKDNSC